MTQEVIGALVAHVGSGVVGCGRTGARAVWGTLTSAAHSVARALRTHQAAEVDAGLATLKALIDKDVRAVTPYVVFLKVMCCPA